MVCSWEGGPERGALHGACTCHSFFGPRGAHVPQEWCNLAQQFFKVASSDRVSGVTQRTVSLWREVQRCATKRELAARVILGF